eukprot:TRINITY_DN38086_c0_g1_i1.p1 TRINITY_DN38086_c0_g1~~TRINITY_DN38086_c0_g1_i1.p1  ORF type:complete len:696 (+),score=141.53 TRINITY_DN38086_c0_g1_i1:63-2150(+)
MRPTAQWGNMMHHGQVQAVNAQQSPSQAAAGDQRFMLSLAAAAESQRVSQPPCIDSRLTQVQSLMPAPQTFVTDGFRMPAVQASGQISGQMMQSRMPLNQHQLDSNVGRGLEEASQSQGQAFQAGFNASFQAGFNGQARQVFAMQAPCAATSSMAPEMLQSQAGCSPVPGHMGQGCCLANQCSSHANAQPCLACPYPSPCAQCTPQACFQACSSQSAGNLPQAHTGDCMPCAVQGQLTEAEPSCQLPNSRLPSLTLRSRPMLQPVQTLPMQQEEENDMDDMNVAAEAASPSPSHTGGSTFKTTLMIRNIPAHVTQQDLLDELDRSGFANHYDFAYLPAAANGEGKGYAFVNTLSPALCGSLIGAWHRTCRFGIEADGVVLNLSTASLQGFEANVKKWESLAKSGRRNLPFVRNLGAQEKFCPKSEKDGAVDPQEEASKKLFSELPHRNHQNSESTDASPVRSLSLSGSLGISSSISSSESPQKRSQTLQLLPLLGFSSEVVDGTEQTDQYPRLLASGGRSSSDHIKQVLQREVPEIPAALLPCPVGPVDADAETAPALAAVRTAAKSPSAGSNSPAGERPMTTLMIRNLPKHITQQELIQELDRSGFADCYDFVYLPPSSFDGSGNKGYAFVNLTSAALAGTLIGAWQKSRRFGQESALSISAAALQGYEANLEKWGRSRTTRIRNPNFRPWVPE